MFTIIGGDGKEYGPVTLAQVKTWIADGRANLDTKAKRTGDEEWQRLGNFPEFNASASADAAATESIEPEVVVEETGPINVDPKAYAEDLIARA